MKRHATPFLVAAALAVLPLTAQAQLQLLGQATSTGGGLGSVATVLTLSSPGNATAESGCVSPTGITSCGFANVGVMTGASQTQVQPLTAFPGISGTTFRLFLNATESGNDNSIIVNDLVVRLYNSAGTQTFSSASLPTPIPLTGAGSGIGNFGFLFGLSTIEAGMFTTALASSVGGTIGVGTSITNASGGPETISVGLVAGGPGPIGTVVPEPSTYLLMASGLAGILLIRRQRRA